tara:strand:+ start:1068 stop:1304 length:237 start_codon:yes stop_codon:yes gene_type:complete
MGNPEVDQGRVVGFTISIANPLKNIILDHAAFKNSARNYLLSGKNRPFSKMANRYVSRMIPTGVFFLVDIQAYSSWHL